MLRVLFALLSISCVLAQTPAKFNVVFQTTVNNGTGKITLHVERNWSPYGVDRFYQLMTLAAGSYYNQNGFFRVVPNFVVQFGINGDPTISQKWENANIPDDPVILSNIPGTVSYADAGANTRTTQLFINYVNNSFLDGEGFTPFAVITSGLDVALAINPQYGENPDQGMIYSQGNPYLKQNFPNLDYITKAIFVKDEEVIF